MLPEDITSVGPDLAHADDIPDVVADPQAPVTHAADIRANSSEPEKVVDEDIAADEDISSDQGLPVLEEGSKDVVEPFEDMTLATALAKIKEAYKTITSGGDHTRAVLAGLHRMHPRAQEFPEEGLQGYKFMAIHGANTDPGCLNALMTYVLDTVTAYTLNDTPTVLLSIDMRCHGEADRFLEVLIEWLTLASPTPATNEFAIPEAVLADIPAPIAPAGTEVFGEDPATLADIQHAIDTAHRMASPAANEE